MRVFGSRVFVKDVEAQSGKDQLFANTDNNNEVGVIAYVGQDSTFKEGDKVIYGIPIKTIERDGVKLKIFEDDQIFAVID